MTEAEMIDEAKTAFIKRGFWPNDVMWACWLDAWRQSALMEREALAKKPLTTVTTGHCKEKAKAGGCQLHNIQCGFPACDRKES